jgi:integrase
VEDLDLDLDVIPVVGKGGGTARCPSAKAGQALERYLRVLRRHRFAHRPELWLSQKGPLTGDGIRQMLDRRCRRAGIPRLNPHRFRHTSVGMALYGWKSRQMLNLYGAARAEDRARAAKRRLAPADRI